MKSDLSTMNKMVDFDSNSIKYLDRKMIQLSTTFNQRKSRTLLSDTVQNPRNDGSCIAIITSSGKILPKAHLVVSLQVDDVDFEDEINDAIPVESEKL